MPGRHLAQLAAGDVGHGDVCGVVHRALVLDAHDRRAEADADGVALDVELAGTTAVVTRSSIVEPGNAAGTRLRTSERATPALPSGKW